MSGDALYLVKVPIRVPSLMQIARRRQIRIRELDEGYLVHALFRELWQESAPAPYLLRGRGREIDAWGYTRAPSEHLCEHASSFGDPESIAALVLDDVHGKPMPQFQKGRRLGFHLRACPVSRRGRANGRAPVERDVFLSRVQSEGPGVTVSREEVYRDWLTDRLRPDRAGASVEHVRVDGFTRERLIRRISARGEEKRRAKVLERPDVHFSGILTVTDCDLFQNALRQGIGRHKAFGFGMLLVVPPGRQSASPDQRSGLEC